MNKNNFGFLFLLLAVSLQAQEIVPFKEKYKTFVKGDFIFVSNNIVNREASFQSPNTATNETGPTAKLNDEYEMAYIDVDDDATTFSSSSATLKIPHENSKIVYAALYWSATYNSEKSEQKNVNKFKIVDKKRDKKLNEVKFKTPGSSDYNVISGNIIYDGNKKGSDFVNSSPYAVFADVTDLVTKQSDPNGEYTVANVAATQGQLEGGVSGGWTLFVVYENDALSGKFISSYDGFAAANDAPISINYSGFTAAQSGTIKAKIGMVALEGDNSLTGDSFSVKSSESKMFTKLKTKTRSDNGFFNSSITDEDEIVYDRKPNSKNTLGYDACTLTINNTNNSVFSSSTNAAILKLQASGDRYFMFFNVFSIETIPFDDDKKPIAINTDVEPVAVVTTTKKPEVVPTPRREIEVIKTEKPAPTVVERPRVDNSITNISYEKMDGVRKGYYIVANVFAIPNNATRFRTKLAANRVGIPQIFRNPVNNYDYVYIQRLDNEQEALQAFQNFKNSYSDPLWIKAINVD